VSVYKYGVTPTASPLITTLAPLGVLLIIVELVQPANNKVAASNTTADLSRKDVFISEIF
jgi:hypothetical protein